MLRLRGHHLFCSQTFIGKGYNASFVANLHSVIERLRNNEIIEIVDGADDICAGLTCSPERHCELTRINQRDELALSALGDLMGRSLKVGDQLLPRDVFSAALRLGFKNDPAENMSDARLRACCVGCQWRDICNEVAANDFSASLLYNKANGLVD